MQKNPIEPSPPINPIPPHNVFLSATTSYFISPPNLIHHLHLPHPEFRFCNLILGKYLRLPTASSIMGPIVITQLATGLSVLAGAVLVKTMIEEKPMAGSFPRCSSCNGTGRVSCLCSRWSDGDVGCRTCSGSGRMFCSSCGGTGTGRPIPAQVSIRRPNPPS